MTKQEIEYLERAEELVCHTSAILQDMLKENTAEEHHNLLLYRVYSYLGDALLLSGSAYRPATPATPPRRDTAPTP